MAGLAGQIEAAGFRKTLTKPLKIAFGHNPAIILTSVRTTANRMI